LLNQGAQTLSSAELLAILLRTGIKGKPVMELASDLLACFGGLHQLLTADVEQFCQLPGLGKTKYVQLQAALEINRRFLFEKLQQQDALKNSVQTREYFLSKLGHKTREVFACLFLSSQYHVLGYSELFQGSVNQAEVYPREIVKAALQHNSAAVIVAHNHPSNCVDPSEADLQLTRQLKRALALMDIVLLDHIVIGKNQTLSFIEHGFL
jgi:DNA repair protein RadC